MSDCGKGSSPRPFSVDQETFVSNWERIFGKKDSQKETKVENKFDIFEVDHGLGDTSYEVWDAETGGFQWAGSLQECENYVYVKTFNPNEVEN